jgi:hypothetical protein
MASFLQGGIAKNSTEVFVHVWVAMGSCVSGCRGFLVPMHWLKRLWPPWGNDRVLNILRASLVLSKPLCLADVYCWVGLDLLVSEGQWSVLATLGSDGQPQDGFSIQLSLATSTLPGSRCSGDAVYIQNHCVQRLTEKVKPLSSAL